MIWYDILQSFEIFQMKKNHYRLDRGMIKMILDALESVFASMFSFIYVPINRSMYYSRVLGKESHKKVLSLSLAKHL